MKFRYVVPALFALASGAIAESDAASENHSVTFKPTSIKAPFLEQFLPTWNQRWTPSSTKKVVDGVEDDELLQYRGEWAVEEPTKVLIEGDKGLVVKSAAAHHAIAAKFDKPIDPTGKPLVVQYEVKLQNGLECGGAYMKLLTEDKNFDPKKYTDKTPYTIMFGPDKCGHTNKVHFIFRHKNPITGEFEEKHINAPPAAKADKNIHLYTLIVKPDQTFRILIDNEEVKKGSLLEDFTPAVNPPKEISDPEDKKPSDWVDDEKVVDAKAKKPEDWDESAPSEILDEDAKTPADWLVNEPSTIPDPEAKKPEDWDDEEDGDWIAPSIPNPKCESVSGCGEWKRPYKKNPNYKGKWTAPLIDNPLFKGIWEPRKIANPAFFEDKTPSNFNKIGAIGFELWTMQDGIQFDNIYVGHSADDAQKLAEETYVVKAKIEKELEPKTPEAEKKENEDDDDDLERLPLIENIKAKVFKFADHVQLNPLEAIKTAPEVAGGLAAAVLIPLFLITSLFGGSSAAPQKVKDAKNKAVKAAKNTTETVKAKASETAENLKKKANNLTSSDSEEVVEKKTTIKRKVVVVKNDE
ncbi:Calreticulin family-domain-containing protein [Phlyctochytrium arcticum]|nr:Calreticulin family-domain-containing protein [Phlyctochytrium arcticum]